MRQKAAITLAALAALIVAFLAGRYSRSPEVRETVRTETKVEYQDRWQTKIEYRDVVKWKERVVAVEVVRPDGSIERTTTTDRGADVNTALDANGSGSATAAASERQESERVETSLPSLRIGFASMWSLKELSLKPPRVQAEADVRLGRLPVLVGARVQTDPARPFNKDATYYGVALSLEK